MYPQQKPSPHIVRLDDTQGGARKPPTSRRSRTHKKLIALPSRLSSQTPSSPAASRHARGQLSQRQDRSPFPFRPPRSARRLEKRTHGPTCPSRLSSQTQQLWSCEGQISQRKKPFLSRHREGKQRLEEETPRAKAVRPQRKTIIIIIVFGPE